MVTALFGQIACRDSWLVTMRKHMSVRDPHKDSKTRGRVYILCSGQNDTNRKERSVPYAGVVYFLRVYLCVCVCA